MNLADTIVAGESTFYFAKPGKCMFPVSLVRFRHRSRTTTSEAFDCKVDLEKVYSHNGLHDRRLAVTLNNLVEKPSD